MQRIRPHPHDNRKKASASSLKQHAAKKTTKSHKEESDEKTKKDEEEKELERQAKISRGLIELIAKNKKLEKELSKAIKTFTSHVDSWNEQLKTITHVNACADQTLSNVLLAIKQNEYLQAWYPEQHNYPDMKVTGKHPAQTNWGILPNCS